MPGTIFLFNTEVFRWHVYFCVCIYICICIKEKKMKLDNREQRHLTHVWSHEKN